MRLWILGFLLLAANAEAATVTINWGAPTMCTDGTPIANCPITKYTLYSGLSGTTKSVLGTTAPNVLTFSATGTGPGNWCIQVSASSAGGESPLSNEACVVVPVPAPGAPGTPTLTVTVTAPLVFDPIKSADTIALLPVGFVPMGQSCDTSQGIVKAGVTYFVVPMSSVKLTGTVKPVAVVAQCS